LRNNDPKPEDLDDPSLRLLSNLVVYQSPPVGKIDEVRRESAVDDVVNWLRRNKSHAQDIDDPTLHSVASVVERPLPLAAFPPLNQRVADETADWSAAIQQSKARKARPTSSCNLAGAPLPPGKKMP